MWGNIGLYTTFAAIYMELFLGSFFPRNATGELDE